MDQVKRQRLKKKYRKLLADSSWALSFGDKLDGDIDLLVYVVHVASGSIKLLGLCNLNSGKPSGLTIDQLSSQAGDLIKLYATKTYSHMLTEKEMLELLGSSLGEYVTKTQSYQVAKNIAGTGTARMIVMYMDDPYDKASFYVRPNPLSDTNFSPEDIQHVVSVILAEDKRNYPERFKSADILEFKANKVEL